MSATIILITIFSATFILGYIITPYIANLSRELHLYDLPNSRKVHKIPIPRTGGLVFLPIVTIVIGVTILMQQRIDYADDALWKDTSIQNLLGYVAGGMMLYIIGAYDDIHGVSYKVKFVVQIVAAAMLCVSGLWVANLSHICMIDNMPWWIGMPFTVLCVVYLTNAMNLIDGIDGLAAGLAAISLTVIAALNILCHDITWAMIAIAFLGVVLAYFYYNVFGKEHKIFMGDAGSLTLGFTLSFLILHFWQRQPVWNPYLHNIGIIVISTLVIPMFDVVRVMMSRLRDHRNPFLPDKNHIHHKLMRAGLSGRMTMITILLLDCMFIISNYLVANISQTLILFLDVVLFCLMHLIINVFIAKKEAKEGIEWTRTLKV